MVAKRKKKAFNYKRAFWKGSLSFGLVNIPVALITAEEKKGLHFHMLDKRDNSPIGYRTYNKRTGKEVRRREIVKAFEYEKGSFVVVTDSDFERANVKATRQVEIEDFVDLAEVDPMLFDRPYYVVPQKGAEKGYALLRDVLRDSQKAAIAKIVMHKNQKLAAISAKGDYLVLETLRFADEVIEVKEANFLDPKVAEVKTSARDLKIAERLVEEMTSPWKPEKYHDTYREDLMRLIQKKAKKGGAIEVEEVETPATSSAEVVDLTSLLERSLKKGRKRKEAA
jgi:DNA end-binding protein Ku